MAGADRCFRSLSVVDGMGSDFLRDEVTMSTRRRRLEAVLALAVVEVVVEWAWRE